MYLIVIAWFYVTVMMAVAEASTPQGTILGALITFVLYGLLPMSILIYILGTPARKRKIKAQQQAQQHIAANAQDTSPPVAAPATSDFADAGRHAPGMPPDRGVSAVREES